MDVKKKIKGLTFTNDITSSTAFLETKENKMI
jgi:hypothetical protein